MWQTDKPTPEPKIPLLAKLLLLMYHSAVSRRYRTTAISFIAILAFTLLFNLHRYRDGYGHYTYVIPYMWFILAFLAIVPASYLLCLGVKRAADAGKFNIISLCLTGIAVYIIAFLCFMYLLAPDPADWLNQDLLTLNRKTIGAFLIPAALCLTVILEIIFSPKSR